MKELIVDKNVVDQRESLRLRLQQNRRVIKHALDIGEEEFPRSFSMRLITHNKAAVGIYLFRIVSRSFSFIKFIKRKFDRNNYIEHGEVK